MDVASNERTTAYESVHLYHYIWSSRSGSLINKQESDVCRIANSSCEIYECYKIVYRLVCLFYYTVHCAESHSAQCTVHILSRT